MIQRPCGHTKASVTSASPRWQFPAHEAWPKARDENGRWDILGGGLKQGVLIEENIKREAVEELCTELLDPIPLGYSDIHRTLPDGTKTHWVALYFCCKVNRDSVKIGEPGVIDEIDWFTFDSLPSPLHSMFGKIIERREIIEEIMSGPHQ